MVRDDKGIAITGEWTVFARIEEQSSEALPIGTLQLGHDAYRFVRAPGGVIPGRMAERTVFLRQPRGVLRVRYGDGIEPGDSLSAIFEKTPGRLLLAFLTFGDEGGECEYAVVACEGRLSLAPMFHVAYGINEPPIVLR